MVVVAVVIVGAVGAVIVAVVVGTVGAAVVVGPVVVVVGAVVMAWVVVVCGWRWCVGGGGVAGPYPCMPAPRLGRHEA